MTLPSWVRHIALAGSVCLLAGCAAKGLSPLYMWETFPRQQYDTLRRDGVNPGEQIKILEAQAEKARGANAALPPGFRAHLGMLYLGAGDSDRARDLWVSEKTAFPESAPYMDKLLKKFDGPGKPAKNESPS